MLLENPEAETRWYFRYFLGRSHTNYVMKDAKSGYDRMILSVLHEESPTESVRVILWKKSVRPIELQHTTIVVTITSLPQHTHTYASSSSSPLPPTSQGSEHMRVAHEQAYIKNKNIDVKRLLQLFDLSPDIPLKAVAGWYYIHSACPNLMPSPLLQMWKYSRSS